MHSANCAICSICMSSAFQLEYGVCPSCQSYSLDYSSHGVASLTQCPLPPSQPHTHTHTRTHAHTHTQHSGVDTASPSDVFLEQPHSRGLQQCLRCVWGGCCVWQLWATVRNSSKCCPPWVCIRCYIHACISRHVTPTSNWFSIDETSKGDFCIHALIT